MAKEKLFGWAFMVMMMAMSFSACSDNAEEILSQESEIKLTSEITPSRVTSLDYQSTQIVAGQQVGVTIAGAKTDDHNNVVWNVGENGALTNTGDKVYYGAGDATITAYHPYNSAWTGTSYSFSVSTDQSIEENYSNSDLLWATTTSSKTENAVPLEFAHKLAKINVTLVPEEDTMDLSGATISICNTKISTTFNPTTGAISEASGDPQEIKAGVTTADAKTASAIVVPQTVNSGSQFIKIALGEKIFYYTLSANKELKSGYSHNYTLTVKEQKVEVRGESEIANWTDEDNVGDAEEFNETLLLPDGQNFNEIVGEYLTANPGLTKIKFITNSDVTSESILVTDDDGTKGYLVANEEWLEIHTYASEFVANGDCRFMFEGNDGSAATPFSALTHIDFGDKFNTSNVTDMGWMFIHCSSLTSLDLSSFDTSNVTYMLGLFLDCSSLTSLNLSSFDTSNVGNMSGMFENCSSLTSLNLSSFNTSNVREMNSMFSTCSSLTSLDLSSFNTSNVSYMGYMFNDCSNLTSLDLSSFDTSNVREMNGMFSTCSSLLSLDVSLFDTSNVGNMSGMFENCSNLTSLDLSSFNTSNVNYMSDMFNGCSSLTSLNLSSFDTSKVSTMYAMFNGCSSLTSLNLSSFNTSNVTDMSGMFNGCSSLTSLDLSSFNTSKVSTMYAMFNGCSNLTSLNLSSFNTSNVTSMGWMFVNCFSLTSLDLSSFDTSNVTNMYAMFYDCSSLTSLDLSSFNTSNVTDMGYMFDSCSSLTSLDLSSFDTSNVTNMYAMFYDCSSLTSLDLSSFKTSKVSTMYAMFHGCSNLTSLNLSSFNTSNVTSMGWMFYDCSNLTSLDLSSFNTSNVTDMGYMFDSCSSLTSLNLSSFKTSNVTIMIDMFDGCCNLTFLDLSNFTFEKAPSVSSMMYNVGANVIDKPIHVKVTEEGYIYLTQTTTNCGIDATAAKFVQPNDTDWVTE